MPCGARTGALALLFLLFGLVAAHGARSHDGIEDKLQQCQVVQDLNRAKVASDPGTSTLTSRIFAVLFPGSPAINALLATLYISGPPNLLLALCPPNIDPNSLSIMVAFAVGGLLGDTLFHLLPEIFLGEDSPTSVRFVMVQPNRNLLLGVGILVGLVTFMIMDKCIRIASGGAAHDHSHGAAPTAHAHAADTAKTTATESDSIASSVKRRRADAAPSSSSTLSTLEPPSSTQPPKLSGYLNLLADFTHNITDGLAMSSSFYASPTIGATTTIAVFFHEIPHEVGDFALLIQSGFTKRQAMGAQFVTALGALLGTLLGILVQELGGHGHGDHSHGGDAAAAAAGGLWGTGLGWGDMLLPFTAGTFLYVGTVAVIPELLETGGDKQAEIKKLVSQLLAMATGAGIMLYISWS